jgi:hypothetical protein
LDLTDQKHPLDKSHIKLSYVTHFYLNQRKEKNACFGNIYGIGGGFSAYGRKLELSALKSGLPGKELFIFL